MEVGSKLEARCSMAMAHVLAPIDLSKARELAAGAINFVLDFVLTQHHPEHVMPWELKGQKTLEHTFEKAMSLHEQRLDKEAVLQDSVYRLLDEAPSREDIYSRLVKGESVSFNGHSLFLKNGFLAGTNDYGNDYSFGELSLERIGRWRVLMATSEVIGPAEFDPYRGYDGQMQEIENWLIRQRYAVMLDGLDELTNA